MNSDYQYEKLYYTLLEGLEKMHERNIRRTKSTLRGLLIVPTIFLVLLFLSNSDENKTIFMVLWILSMFVIAAILIVIEYQDYQLKNVFVSIQETQAPPQTEPAEKIEAKQLPAIETEPAPKQLEPYEELRRDIQELSEETETTAQ